MEEKELSLAGLRKEYSKDQLIAEELLPDAIRQFDVWFKETLAADIREPNAMTIATVDAQGQPTVRIVLLKGYDTRGFQFYTNYKSRKAQELEQNPKCALCFLWLELERQVRIRGVAEKLSREESLEYWKQRPRGSQLGALASAQSQPIPSREYLEERLQDLNEQYKNQDVPMPDNWGGYNIRPTEIEFWQGRPNRLHDRFLYEHTEDGNWKVFRLAP